MTTTPTTLPALRVAAAALALWACGCSAEEALGPIGATLGEHACGRGLALVSSDYQSSSVAVIDAGGQVASPHLLSSGSAPPTLSAPLSGDVVVPGTRLIGPEAVLLDRYPASVLTWVTLASAQVRAQLDVSTGFSANPQDYLPLDLQPGSLAYVSRLDSNPAPGAHPFDGGGDVLLVDSAAPAIVARIDLAAAMSDAPGYLPRPNAMTRLGARVAVLLSAYDAGFADAAPSRVALLNPADHSLSAVTVLDGLYGCATMAAAPPASPSETPARLAVACSGRFGGDASPSLDESGVIVLDEAGAPLQRWSAAELGGRPLGLALDWLDAQRLLVVTLGSFETSPPTPDALVEVDIASGTHRVLHGGGALPFELGHGRCLHRDADGPDAAACGQCWLADAERGTLLRFDAGSAGAEAAGELRIDDGIGLPPRVLGRL